VLTNSAITLVGLESFSLQPEPLAIKPLADNIIVYWENRGASRYELQTTTSLQQPVSWSVDSLGPSIPGYGEIASVTNSVAEPMRFFRLQRWR
jgi:hypothetical protein